MSIDKKEKHQMKKVLSPELSSHNNKITTNHSLKMESNLLSVDANPI